MSASFLRISFPVMSSKLTPPGKKEKRKKVSLNQIFVLRNFSKMHKCDQSVLQEHSLKVLLVDQGLKAVQVRGWRMPWSAEILD